MHMNRRTLQNPCSRTLEGNFSQTVLALFCTGDTKQGGVLLTKSPEQGIQKIFLPLVVFVPSAIKMDLPKGETHQTIVWYS